MPRDPRRAGPHYPLAEVQALARRQPPWASKTRAIDPIVRRRACTISEARRYAIRVILSLTAEDFSTTTTLTDRRPADVYGCWVDELGWYVKVTIAAVRAGQEEVREVEILSCHPPEYDLRTRSGVVPRGGVRRDHWPGGDERL